MSNETTTTPVTTLTASGEVRENANLTTTNVVLSEDFNNALDAKLAQLKAGKMQKGMSLAPQYFEFESKGDSTQGIFLGFKTITKLDDKGATKNILCVAWADIEKRVFINGGTAFTGAFETLSIGQAFEATLIELKPTKSGGKVKIYEINPLF
jgi:hypothetical protein